MKVKMFSYFQGTGVSALLLPDEKEVPVLEPGKVYEVGDEMGAFLLKYRKAERVEESEQIEVATMSDPEPVFIGGLSVEPSRDNDEQVKPEEVKPRRKRGKK